MKTKSILAFLALLPALFSCQSEAEALEESQESNVVKPELRLRAFLDTHEDSRAAMEYGHQDENEEIFTWSDDPRDGDYITLFNITKFSEFHQSHLAPLLYIDSINGQQAEFVYEPTDDGDYFFKLMEPGDIILAVVREAHSGNLADCKEGSTNVISYEAASQLYDQQIVENPTTETAMRHVHMMTHLYDVVKVGADTVIPDLHFKHMCAIFRVTLQNQTGKPLFSNVSEMVFTAPSEDMRTFIYGFNYFSVAGNETDGFYLKENFKVAPPRHPLNPIAAPETVVHSHKATHRINQSANNRIPLKDGATYEFYAVVTPRIGERIGNTETIKELTIDVFDSGAESGYYENMDVDRYTITIHNFNTAIEPGKRYWFKLTATNEEVEVDVNEYDENDNVIGTTKRVDHRLMFTSEWNAKYNPSSE